MPGHRERPPILKFTDELLAVFLRWSEESDLGPLELAEAAVTVINNFCDEPVMDFAPAKGFIDEVSEEEE